MPKDAIIKVTSCAICGSDLHLFHNCIPAMMPGDVVGHEMMGEVVETGSDVKKLKKGDRIVIPFTINCDECDQCRRGNYLAVRALQPQQGELADKVFGHRTAGLFGYTHLTGGYAGRPGRISARALRRRHPHQGARRHDRRAGSCSSATSSRPAGRPRSSATSSRPTSVAIWGAGPVGQMAIRSAILLGAKQGHRDRPAARAAQHGRGGGRRARSTSRTRASSSG